MPLKSRFRGPELTEGEEAHLIGVNSIDLDLGFREAVLTGLDLQFFKKTHGARPF